MSTNDQPDRRYQQPRARVVLVLVDAGDPVSADARLKRLVKAAGRAYGWRLVSIRDDQPEGSPSCAS